MGRQRGIGPVGVTVAGSSVVALLLACSPAWATSASVDAGTLRVKGTPKKNQIAVQLEYHQFSGWDWWIHSHDPVSTGPGCTIVNGGPRCPYAGITKVRLGGRGGRDFLQLEPRPWLQLAVAAGGRGDDGIALTGQFAPAPAGARGVGKGGRGADSVYGQPGSDKLLGGSGPDFLRGLEGPDRLVGGPGMDKFRGDEGSDFVQARDGRRDGSINCGPDQDRVRHDRGLDRRPRDC